ncbi:M15 family metallopeptidase [Paenibacillus glufosinatiresistens]|uniref:M15 family metallopeptidase n=1 Tax=Paenibacillus glufosinatiresistens TaxID=3070657 RepID=UPI00286EACAC|nr:M15 family metallopeptidase [Paenibacillus sp. YX.27]
MLTVEAVKAKSNSKLVGLHPAVLAATLTLIKRCYATGIPIVITQGLRTIQAQNELYAQGRTQAQLQAAGITGVTARPDLPVVTNARGGYSYHNFGLAVDFALLANDGKQVSWDLNRDANANRRKDWDEVVEAAKKLGFEWGGDFVSIHDAPHLEMTFGLSTAELRAGNLPKTSQTQPVYRQMMKMEEEQRVNKDTHVTVRVNGARIGEGILDGGITYAPVRAVAEALGASVVYDSKTLTVNVTGKEAAK